LIDAAIYLGIVLLPFVIPVLAVIAVVVYFNRRKKKPAKLVSPPSDQP
jgi:hypothetical protein